MLPDFLIIGAMKAGTTSLFRWLEVHPECALPKLKEPDFFSDEVNWARGTAWYRSLFTATEGFVTGEASTSYTDVKVAHVAAGRIHELLPNIRCIFLVRDPEERLRSQYRHEVQRHRENREFSEAVEDIENEYVMRSMYWKCIQPYTEYFSRDQICVVHFEDLFFPPYSGWNQVLSHLFLRYVDVPLTVHNTSANKERFTRPMLYMWERGWLKGMKWVPSILRRAGKRLVMRNDQQYRSLMRSSIEDPVPAEILRILNQDWERFEDWSSSGTIA